MTMATAGMMAIQSSRLGLNFIMGAIIICNEWKSTQGRVINGL